MKKLCSCIAFSIMLFFFAGCGLQTNITVTTTNGSCATGQSNAPYCLAVTLQNNSGGQNWISNTNYPLTDVSVSVSGANNVLSPASSSSMDPNGCTSNSTDPGSSCTFYLQINQEDYAVGSQTPVTVTINYTINDGLSAVFGGSSGGSTYSYSFTVNEYANLYVVEQSGTNNVSIYNNSGISNYTVESTSSTTVQSAAVDNSSFGYVWLATSQGMYWFGNGNSSGSTVYNPYGTTSINNIFTSQPSPFESSSSSPTTMYGVAGSSLYAFTFSTLAWGSAITATSSSLMNNVNAISSSGSYALLATSSQVFACPTTSGSSGCSNEASSISGIADLGFVTSSASGYTGLYIATTGGLYVESGSFPSTTNGWEQVTESGIGGSYINAVATDDSGGLYAGGTSGDIWYVDGASTPTVATWIYNVSNSVTGLVFDNIGNTLYLTAGSVLYECDFSSGSSCSSLGSVGSNTVVGLFIGSSLSQ